MNTNLPRGLRNFNPGNVEYHPGPDPWLGLDNPPDDGRFCKFIAPEYGIRVIAKLLLAYQQYGRLRTIRQMINRWAPPHENDTGAYAVAVAREMGVSPDEDVSVSGPHIMLGMVKAIIHHENGQQPYPDALIQAGIAMVPWTGLPSDAGKGVWTPPALVPNIALDVNTTRVLEEMKTASVSATASQALLMWHNPPTGPGTGA